MNTMASSGIVFRFNAEDRALVRAEALRRQRFNEKKGLEGRNGGPKEGEKALFAHKLGAAGELAVADFLQLREFLYQETEAIRGSFDLPPNIDVKTRSHHDYDLICQLDEKPGKILVLVTIQNKITLLHGWIKSEDAMKEQWKKDPAHGRPAYFVPQSALLSLVGLRHAEML
jgi:hypothetical protein